MLTELAYTQTSQLSRFGRETHDLSTYLTTTCNLTISHDSAPKLLMRALFIHFLRFLT